MRHRRVLLVAASIFSFLLFALLRHDPPPTEGFDQSFYYTIAHDLDRYGVYSNGIFGPPDSDAKPPPPGMFFMPLYPTLVWTVMRADKRFAETIYCANTLRQERAAHKPCQPYSRPMMVVHAFLLTIGILAIGWAGQELIDSVWAFFATSLVATIGVFSHVGMFIWMMTESLSFCLYSLSLLAFILAVKRESGSYFIATGCLTALLVLARPSFLALVPVFLLIFLFPSNRSQRLRISIGRVLLFAACFWAVLLPWQIRNYVSLGKFGLSEEYGAQQIAERFGFNKMTLQEGLLAVPSGLPQIGVSLTKGLFGNEGIRRFGWSEPDGFYADGMALRLKLIDQYGRVDTVIASVIADEMRRNWWRHLLTTLPITWIGMWVGHTWGLFLIPIFACVVISAVRRKQRLFLAYSIPALAMGLVHGAVANHNVRYNLGFIGPISVAAAYTLLLAIHRGFQRGTFGLVRSDLASTPTLIPESISTACSLA